MPRQPQQDRSRATRQGLLSATIESLAEVGWAGTTVVAVAQRAGVSRGAAQHHFATRDELVQAAVHTVARELTEDLAARGAELDVQDDRVLGVLEALVGIWTGPFGRAATHLWVAASTDPSLRALVLPLERQFNRDVYRVTLELLRADGNRPEVREAVQLTLDLVRGIGLSVLLRPERRRRDRRRAELVRWSEQLAATIGVPASGDVMRTEPKMAPSV